MPHTSFIFSLVLFVTSPVYALDLNPRTCEVLVAGQLKHCREITHKTPTAFSTCHVRANKKYRVCAKSLSVRGIL